MALPSLSVVVPIHDEVGAIEALALEITRSLAPLTAWECIWVDDASTDGSREVLRTIAARDAHHRVLVLPEHRGEGRPRTVTRPLTPGGDDAATADHRPHLN